MNALTDSRSSDDQASKWTAISGRVTSGSAPEDKLTDQSTPHTGKTNGLPRTASTVTEPTPGMSSSTGSSSTGTGTDNQASQKAGSAVAVIGAVAATCLVLLIAGLPIIFCYIQR